MLGKQFILVHCHIITDIWKNPKISEVLSIGSISFTVGCFEDAFVQREVQLSSAD